MSDTFIEKIMHVVLEHCQLSSLFCKLRSCDCSKLEITCLCNCLNLQVLYLSVNLFIVGV